MTPSTPVQVGRFHQGRLAEGGRPQSLDTWRVTADDAQVAARIADLLGGQSVPNDGGGKAAYEVLTTRESVRILVDGPDALTARMVLRGTKGVIHDCDGSAFLAPEKMKGEPCGCPPSVADRKALAREGRGPQPAIDLVFRLVAAPLLGEFNFSTTSWQVAEQLPQLTEDLARAGSPAVCTLTKKLVVYETRSGTSVCYHKTVIIVLGSPDTVTPEPSPSPDPAPALTAPPHPHIPIRSHIPGRRPQPSPSSPESTCSVDLDIALLVRAAQALGTTGHRETVIAALSLALENRRQAEELHQLRQSVELIAATARQALQAGDE
jgi:Arc/MetJ family transcription regulator